MLIQWKNDFMTIFKKNIWTQNNIIYYNLKY